MPLHVARCPLLAQRFLVSQEQLPRLQSRPTTLSVAFSRPCRLPESSIPAHHLFLLRFYMYGREPESINRYLQDHLRNEKLRVLFGIVNVEKYADKPWLST